MGYISTKEAAKKWGISQRRVICLASAGRIEGAASFGINWMIPEDAAKPTDGRKKAARALKQASPLFRFPMYINGAEGDYLPPLTNEERTLRQAQLAFYACRFEQARPLILSLSEHAENRYVRIAAWYYRCCIAAYDSKVEDFEHSFSSFNASLAEDFPHKAEMLLLRCLLDVDSGYHYKFLLNGFRIRANEAYHPSTYDIIAFLSVFSLSNGDFSLLGKLRFESYEMLCMRMEHDGHFLEAQALHYVLLEIYQMQADEEMMLYHARCGLNISLEHDLYLSSALNLFYYPDIAQKVLADYPSDFSEKILALSRGLHEKYVKFANVRSSASYMSILSDREFAFVTLATQEYSNREIARMLKISEKTVSKRYNEIYEKLGIKNKQELVELISSVNR